MTEQASPLSRTTIRDRYHQDAAFQHLVDMMRYVIDRGEFTPTEIREAAMLAQIMYEELNPRPVVFTKDDLWKGKV